MTSEPVNAKVRIPVMVRQDIGPSFFAFYANKRRYPGDKFIVTKEREISEKWMIRLDQKQQPVRYADPILEALEEVDDEAMEASDDMVDVDPRLVNPPPPLKQPKKATLKKPAVKEVSA